MTELTGDEVSCGGSGMWELTNQSRLGISAKTEQLRERSCHHSHKLINNLWETQ